MSEPAPARWEFDSDDLFVRLDMTVSGDVKAITPAVERILGIIRQMECAEGREFEVETAVREALANAIVHGCKEDSDKKVQVVVACEESRGVLIIVRDPGAGFDPASLPSPVVGEAVMEDHGRGIFLINRLMDEVKFERDGTEIWMRKH